MYSIWVCSFLFGNHHFDKGERWKGGFRIVKAPGTFPGSQNHQVISVTAKCDQFPGCWTKYMAAFIVTDMEPTDMEPTDWLFSLGCE